MANAVSVSMHHWIITYKVPAHLLTEKSTLVSSDLKRCLHFWGQRPWKLQLISYSDHQKSIQIQKDDYCQARTIRCRMLVQSSMSGWHIPVAPRYMARQTCLYLVSFMQTSTGTNSVAKLYASAYWQKSHNLLACLADSCTTLDRNMKETCGNLKKSKCKAMKWTRTAELGKRQQCFPFPGIVYLSRQSSNEIINCRGNDEQNVK